MKVPKEVNLNFARKLPTNPRLEYLDDKVGSKTLRDAHTAFSKYLDNDDTKVFFGKFGEKYDTEDSDTEVYYGFYAFNRKNLNMMFFREQKTGIPYKLHAYMKLDETKAKQLVKIHELFN